MEKITNTEIVQTEAENQELLLTEIDEFLRMFYDSRDGGIRSLKNGLLSIFQGFTGSEHCYNLGHENVSDLSWMFIEILKLLERIEDYAIFKNPLDLVLTKSEKSILQ